MRVTFRSLFTSSPWFKLSELDSSIAKPLNSDQVSILVPLHWPVHVWSRLNRACTQILSTSPTKTTNRSILKYWSHYGWANSREACCVGSLKTPLRHDLYEYSYLCCTETHGLVHSGELASTTPVTTTTQIRKKAEPILKCTQGPFGRQFISHLTLSLIQLERERSTIIFKA